MAIDQPGRQCAAWVLALCAIALQSCSGGISGTGDGGPIIVVTNTDLFDSGAPIDGGIIDGSADGTTDGTTDGTAQTDSPELLSLPPRVYFAFPAPLVGASVEAATQSAVYSPLRETFTAASASLLDAQVWIDLVAARLTEARGLCATDNICIASQLSGSYIYTDAIQQADLARRIALIDPLLAEPSRLALENPIRSQLNANLNRVIDISVNNFQPAVAGSLITTIQLQTDGVTLDLSWRSDNNATAIRYTTGDTTLFAKHHANGNRFTTRLHDRQTASVMAAAFEPADNGMLFEADLHRTGALTAQHYVRGFSDQQSGTLISRELASAAALPLSRERFLSSGQVISLQLCDRCASTGSWIEQLADAIDSTEQFANFDRRFGGFEQTIADDVTLENLDDTIDEWLVTRGASDQSPALNAACSGQRVENALRNICFSIAIDPDQARLYSEQLQPNGELDHQRLD